MDESSLRRHHARHLPATLAQSAKASEVARADDLLDEVRELQARALGLLDKAEAAGDFRAAAAAIREARGTMELAAKLVGQLEQDTAKVNVNVFAGEGLDGLRARLVERLARRSEADPG